MWIRSCAGVKKKQFYPAVNLTCKRIKFHTAFKFQAGMNFTSDTCRHGNIWKIFTLDIFLTLFFCYINNVKIQIFVDFSLKTIFLLPTREIAAVFQESLLVFRSKYFNNPTENSGISPNSQWKSCCFFHFEHIWYLRLFLWLQVGWLQKDVQVNT